MIKLNGLKFEELATKEWIVTNGTGGYASSTCIGANRSRYHALLVAALNPPTERRVFVSKVEEAIVINGQRFALSTNEYPGVIHPRGFEYVHSFERKPLPCITFRLGEAVLEKQVFMVYGSNTTVIEYKNKSKFPFQLWLNPLYVYRDFHSTQQERHDHYYKVKFMGHTHRITAADNAPEIFFRHSHGIFTEGRTWNKNLQFRIDQDRGNEYCEDVYSIGYIEYDIQPGESVFLMFTLDHEMLEQVPEKLKAAEIKRLEKQKLSESKDQFFQDLVQSGDQFIVNRKSTNSTSVIAGYHWFTDWGRDSMISVRGLCISLGRKEEARSVIQTFLSYLEGGLIPNRFPDYDGEKVEYNTIDATLWLFVALYDYDLKFKDTTFLKKIFSKLQEIIDFQIQGTYHNIKVLENGFLSGGSRDIQITWMDAKLGDIVFTPRNGCAVEINALWYNTLKTFEHVCKRLKVDFPPAYEKITAQVKENFSSFFWNTKGYLNDTVNGAAVDESIRPNQILAVSLPFALLSAEQEAQVVKTVDEHLRTDYGLRTLDKNNGAFIPFYKGDLMSRDSAYHQGTVWPFLLPEYYLAYLKVHGHSEAAKKKVEEELQPLKKHFYEQECIHGISEIFDGLEPRGGKGCIHQAWSVANLIKLIEQENLQI